MSKRTTMVDIALQAGVSQATVSLVLNDVANARVSPDTRERVRAVAQALGYERRGLAARATGNRVIGMLIDQVVTTPFAAPLLEGARDAAAAQGFVVATFCTGGDAAVEATALDALDGMGHAGVIYATLIMQAVTAPARLAVDRTILLNCHDTARRLHAVVPADVTGAMAAVRALIDAGHRRIGHLVGEDWSEAARDRLRGYRQALSSADIPQDPALVQGPVWTVASGREVALRLLDQPDPPTAIFCYNDRVALGCYEAIRLRGMRVPQDISVVGFDNDDLVAHMLPPLTTVVLPHDEMARWAVDWLIDGQSRSAATPPRKVKIDCSLIARGSVAPPRQQKPAFD